MTTTLGTTFACRGDLTPRFDVCTTDRQIVLDDVYRRLTTDSVIGDSDEAANFGDNVRKLAGGKYSDGEIAGFGPRFAEAIERSRRVLKADVVVTRETAPPGQLRLRFAVTAETPVGPFDFFFLLDGTTFAVIGVAPGSL